MCIGAGFAVYEMCLAIFYIIKYFEVKPHSGEIQYNPLVTLKPVGVEVLFKKR